MKEENNTLLDTRHMPC